MANALKSSLLRRWAIVLGLLGAVLAALAWALVNARELARESVAIGRMGQLSLALQIYRHKHGSFPPAVVFDNDGKPMHSWRVLLLPHLDQGERALASYDMQQPWNSARNMEWLQIDGRGYGTWYDSQSDEDLAETTKFVALTGPTTPWGKTDKSPDEWDCDPQIIVVEVPHSNIHWMEPRDIAATDAAGGLLKLLATDSVKCILSNGQVATLQRSSMVISGAEDRHLRRYLRAARVEP